MEWDIHRIEALSEHEAQTMALDTEAIKAHSVYFVDFGGYFGYSCLVFRNGHHIYYANDYELHHSGKSHAELKQLYIEKLERNLFLDEELGQPLHDYDEYCRKHYFLQNYYVMQTDYVSVFRICQTEKEEKAYKRKIAKLHYNPVSFAYMEDEDFIRKHVMLSTELQKAKAATKTDYEYQKNAFLYEMYNHEYGINWEADHDTLSAFGRVDWHDDLDSYFKELDFNDIKRQAYMDARKEYYRTAQY